MASIRTPSVTSKIMAAVHYRDTQPEMLLRRELWRRGMRYRTRSRLSGKPDLVFSRARVVIFIDGDFWHGNSWKARGYANFADQFVHNNGAFWREKIERNMARDKSVTTTLRAEGWRVVRVWESKVRRDLKRVADEVEYAVRGRTA